MVDVNINAAVVESVRHEEQAVDVATPAAGFWKTYFKADGIYTIDDGGNVYGPLLPYSYISASQLVNEVKGWPPCVKTGDLDALNLWWDKVGTPSTAPSVVALSGEGGITETWELAIKVVTDAASEGLSQTWTYADEPRVKSGRKLSALLAIWSVGAISVTAKLVNSDASETAAAAVTAAAWTIVEIPNHTLAGTSCALQVTAGAAGTFYVVPLGVSIGARGFPLKPRGTVHYEAGDTTLVSAVDPGAAWTDVDCTATTSPLACRVEVYGLYINQSAANKDLSIRRNGSSRAGTMAGIARNEAAANVMHSGRGAVDLDDGNIFEYLGSDVAGNNETVYLFLVGWWEWE